MSSTVRGLRKQSRQQLARLSLQLGLAFVFLYAAVGSLRSPLEWAGYLPPLLTAHFRATALVQAFAVYELLLAGWLVSGKCLRYAAALTALTLAGIVLADWAQLVITFRDVGLAAAALALVLLVP